MTLKQFEVPGLAHYSYLLGSSGNAAVIDPKRDCDTFLNYAKEKGFRITSILKRAARSRIVNVVGGMTAWNAQQLPVTT